MDTKELTDCYQKSRDTLDGKLMSLHKFLQRERIDAGNLLAHALTDLNTELHQENAFHLRDLALKTVAVSLFELSQKVQVNKLLMVFALKLASDVKATDKSFNDIAFLRDCGVDEHAMKSAGLALKQLSVVTVRPSPLSDLDQHER